MESLALGLSLVCLLYALLFVAYHYWANGQVQNSETNGSATGRHSSSTLWLKVWNALFGSRDK
jgi:hypothetical protein